jgi:hypothetical protein
MHLLVKVRPTNLDELLDGAWTVLPKLLRDQPYSHTAIQRALDSYCRSLLTTQQQHDPDTMMRFVDRGMA